MKAIYIGVGFLAFAGQAHAFSYFNNFESPVGSEWNKSDTVSFNSTSVLGRFNNDAVQLTLTGLDVGSTATIKFDLYILDSWDGLGADFGGPDQFRFSVDGNTLLHTTFANTGEIQNYPNAFGGATFASQTGADNVDSSHGGTLPNGNFGNALYSFGGGGMNSEFTTLVTSSTMVLTFEGIALQGVGDESWALDNVSVETSPVPEPTSFLALGFGIAAILRRRRR